MDKNIIHIKSINQLLGGSGFGKATHPLVAIIDTANIAFGEEMLGLRISSDLYSIALKDSSCGLDYGRKPYDFNEGVLFFSAPKQVFTVTKVQKLNDVKGWMLYFHPDLIRNTKLASIIDNYTFFNYEINEALHLSEKEQYVLNNIVNLIENEINERIDNHSQQVLVSNIELILSYSQRFYERQFNTRSAQNTDVVSKVEKLLKNYYKTHELIETGQPSIEYLAGECHLSPNYLSDLLSKETGRSAKEHINDFLIKKAKHLLLSSNNSISGIAYSLGFNYPHYFGRLFKKKTGKTPQEFRQLN
ncbi:helix-turn-helix transcriptional regulator [bacterium]|jgi:AraC-like DNA-binding protein|nr:helix-turn-helix transcriptional regulator [bacterium]MDG1433493.1 helix-turn-helix transcriptional regulator [Saprospiraceae bacterium]